MKLGLHLSNLTFGVEPAGFAAKLDEIVVWAEEAGFDRISVMDHYLQIASVGPAEAEMFEAYGLLGYIAARTKRVELGTLVTGVTYRNPGFLAKQVTGLDVLSGGRAWLGIGAAWYEREHLAYGIPYPPLGQRLAMLEEAVRVCEQMWSDNNGPFEGTYYQMAETLCSPQPVQRPRPPIMIGGSGERKTLRLVARHADRCNVWMESPEHVEHRFEVLAGHCAREGRDYESIERTGTTRFDPRPDGSGADELVDRLGRFAEVGMQGVFGSLIDVHDPKVMDVMRSRVIPQLKKL